MNSTSDLGGLVRALFLECYRAGRSEQNRSSGGGGAVEAGLFCPRTFDGYLCWPRTPAGQRISQSCPAFVTGFDASRDAFKTCQENGKWFAHPESGNEWSNYTTCIDVEDLTFRSLVNNLFVLGYSLSLTALIVSLALLIGFRTLRCTRIRIHVHLFLSLALSCTCWLVWYKVVVENPETMSEYPLACIALHLIIHYLMLTNYFWMFCEGLHLLLVLVVVFLRDGWVLRCFYAVGWFLPLSLVLVYATVRAQTTTTMQPDCWIDEDPSMWILSVPISMSLAASLFFLVYVVRVLVIKLSTSSSAMSSSQPSMAFRKAVRATLILFPLFGLQHILLPLRPESGTGSEKTYQIFSAVIISCQGLCVSVLFCFANHEVIACVHSLLHQLFPWLIDARRPLQWDSVNGPPPTLTRDVVV